MRFCRNAYSIVLRILVPIRSKRFSGAAAKRTRTRRDIE